MMIFNKKYYIRDILIVDKTLDEDRVKVRCKEHSHNFNINDNLI